MRDIALAVAVAVFAATPVLAGDAPSAPAAATHATQTDSAKRVVYICDGSAMTRRGFARDFGSAEYVTAEAAAQKGAVWTAPKCISPAEARRLKSRQLASAR